MYGPEVSSIVTSVGEEHDVDATEKVSLWMFGDSDDPVALRSNTVPKICTVTGVGATTHITTVTSSVVTPGLDADVPQKRSSLKIVALEGDVDG